MEEKNNLIHKVVEYAFYKGHFTFEEMIVDLKLDESEKRFIHNTLLSTNQNTTNPNHLISIIKEVKTKPDDVLSRADHNKSTYTLLPNAYFSYIDHIEIIEARKAAKEAKRLATWSLWISSALAALSIIIGIIQILKK